MTSRIGERRKLAQTEPSKEYLSKRAAIVDAAAGVFSRSGYERASMVEVAAKAGTDRATVYYYFKDKHEIFHAVITDAVQDLVMTAEAIRASGDDASVQVRRLVSEIMRSYAEHFPYLYVYVQEDMSRFDNDSPSARALRQLARRFSVAVEHMISEGIESGVFKANLEPRLTANAILGALNWTHRWFRPGRAESVEEITAVFTEMFLGGITAPGTPRPDDFGF
ncbi:MAG: TetR/AcrR family transcriptional regulator [Nocardioides sp.]|uniref:TetR/AcrR family transcriptional regulator n=1 Tax=Nocardioides sp. TaxID=35761 RepID=UPI0039E6E3D1